MAEVAVDLGLYEGRAAAVSGAFYGLAGRLVDGEEVVAVYHDAGHGEAVGALGDVYALGGEGLGGGLGVAVVLYDEDHRQVPGAGEVQAFEERALVGAAVAGERDGYLLRAAGLRGQPYAADQGRAAADDAVGAEHALIQVGYVHGAALAVAEALLFAVDLEHHSLDVAALGDGVAVAAVGARYVVVPIEVGHDAGGDGLLPGVEVDEARDLARGELRVQPLLELPDGLHGLVGVQKRPPIQLAVTLAGAGNLRHKRSFPQAFPLAHEPKATIYGADVRVKHEIPKTRAGAPRTTDASLRLEYASASSYISYERQGRSGEE